jgi:hypothetical protein
VTSKNKMVNDSISGKPTRNSPMKNTKKLADNFTCTTKMKTLTT